MLLRPTVTTPSLNAPPLLNQEGSSLVRRGRANGNPTTIALQREFPLAVDGTTICNLQSFNLKSTLRDWRQGDG